MSKGMIRKSALVAATGTGLVGTIYFSQRDGSNPVAKEVVPKVHLPPRVQYLLIGGGASTSGAYKAIRSIDPKAQVLIIGQELHQPYMKAPLSKEMWQGDALNDKLVFKQWNGRNRSILFEHPEFFANLDSFLEPEETRVAYVGGLKAVKVDPIAQKVFFENGSAIEYERCMISTGSLAEKHTALSCVPGIKKFMLGLNTIEEFHVLQKAAEDCDCIAVLGNGTVASELVVSIADFGKRANPKLKVVQIFPEVGNLSSILPEYLCKWLTRQIESEGVQVYSLTDIAAGEIVGEKLRLILRSGKKIVVDKLVMAGNIKPDTRIARESGLEIDSINGGVVVNAEMMARSNLYVAGDAASFYDPRLGRRRFHGHEHAVSTGSLAGKNMAGAQKAYSKQTMMWCDIGAIVNFEGVGILDPKLKTYSVFFPESPEENIDFNGKITKGIVFYKNDKDVVVGILLCNIFGRMTMARKIISEQKTLDLKEVAKVFYERYPPEPEGKTDSMK